MIIIDHHSCPSSHYRYPELRARSRVRAHRAFAVGLKPEKSMVRERGMAGGMGHERDRITRTVPTGQSHAPGKALAGTGTTVRSGNSSLILTGRRVRRLHQVGMNREWRAWVRRHERLVGDRRSSRVREVAANTPGMAAWIGVEPQELLHIGRAD
jgi:hypothetical protein